MTSNSAEHLDERPRWRYLLLAVLVFVLTGVLLAVLWQVPLLLPELFPQHVTPHPAATPTAVGASPTPAPAVLPPAPAVLEPTITDLSAEVDDRARIITFHLAAQAPPEREVAEVLLWYDTEAGRSVRRISGPFTHTVTLSYRLDPSVEGLTRTLTTTRELDYWWFLRDSNGESVRGGGTAILGTNLWSSVAPPTPEPPPVDFTWAVSDTKHFRLHYIPGMAAERDRFQIGSLAEESLAEIRSVLAVEFDDQMSIYLVPRIFWQGGAAYGEKVQLISYLDRNYTGIETWSYFTHEGSHALAQDLLEPKENGGGPDGVLVEGLAVWASGGHYRQEPIDAWAAVVAGSDEYLPLTDLRAESFYGFQHETAYLEAASFVKFLVDHYGLDKLKELYGLATGKAEHDDALVERVYGKTYKALESEWLEHLAGLDPTAQQSEMWHLKVRSFDLMRRYETELDPDARLLPPTAPPEWTSDTLKVFLGRVEAPVNVVLETALIAAQERLYDDDLVGASGLLNDVESALDAGGVLTRPSLLARQAILDTLVMQDRAILRGDASAYRATLDPSSALSLDAAIEEALCPPFTAFRRELVRLDLADDGLIARGLVLRHAGVADGEEPGDGQLMAVTFVKVGSRWLLSSQRPTRVTLSLPSVRTD